jgi:site-specific recombinase XerC
MSSLQPLFDAAGRRRSPATTPGCRTGIAPRNKGQRYPADPPAVDEIVAVMRQAGHDRHGHRLSALIVVLWRAGLRINEALSLSETDLDQRRFWSGTARTTAGARSAWTPGHGRRSNHGSASG